uniref:MIF4G-like type 2 domain-containing protein n=1 Tax=Lutzomyia longipalpis TaxID=7200 RepID=A0A1B0CVJ0_LUTLO
MGCRGKGKRCYYSKRKEKDLYAIIFGNTQFKQFAHLVYFFFKIKIKKMVERMEEKLEAANVDQKRLFLIVFQRFIMILSEHLVRCDTDGRDYDTDWYRWTIGRLQQVFLMHHEQVQKYSSTLESLLFTSDLDSHILDHHEQVQKYSSTLESLLFTSDLDSHILDVFHQFNALRA